MTQIVVYALPESEVAVLSPSPDCPLSLEQIIEKDIPSGIPYHLDVVSNLPNITNFRKSWMANFENYAGIYIDLQRSKVEYKLAVDGRAIGLSRPLSEEYSRLIAIGGDPSEVQAQLIAIDLAVKNTDYLAASSVEELITYWPSVLGPCPFQVSSPSLFN